MPVLNQTVSLLSQSMRETEDELARNMLAATAAQVNCVDGTNGRQDGDIAVVKSDLIDFKLLAA